MRQVPLEELNTSLVELSRTWGYVCESICRQVTRRLLALHSTRPEVSACSRQGGGVEGLKGLLRVSYSASAHAHHAHHDGSYTTFLGPGSTAGCLQFATSATASNCEANTEFLPCEHYLQRTAADELGADFFIFTGVKIGSMRDTCKPLLHRVVAPSQPTERESGRVGEPSERINVIYFLNSYSWSPADQEPCDRAARLLQVKGDALFEINSFGQTRILRHADFLCWPPQPNSAQSAAALLVPDVGTPPGFMGADERANRGFAEDEVIAIELPDFDTSDDET